MEASRREHETSVSVLGHPVSGLAPLAFLSAGWIVLAIHVVPWLRDRIAERMLRGETDGLSLRMLSPGAMGMPPSILFLAAVAAGLLLIGAGLTVIWVRSAGGVGPLFDRMLRRNEVLAALVFLGAAVLSAGVLAPGEPSAMDAKTHVARGWLWHEFLRAGAIPLWTDLWYGGTPGDQHYPPLAHLFQALLMFLRLDAGTASKQLAWFARIAGAVGFALLCARMHRDRRAGLLGGTLYAMAPTVHAAWIWEGRAPAAMILAILPWAMLAAERLATGIGGLRSGAGLALALGALAVAHAGQARLAFVLIAILILIRGVSTVATRGERAPSALGLLVGILGGVGLTAAYVVPIWLDAGLLNDLLPSSLAGADLRLPPPAEVIRCFTWNMTGKQYVGLSVALLAIAGIVRAVLDRKEGGRGIGPVPLAILAVSPWFLSSPWWRGLDLIPIGLLLAAAGSVRRPPEPRYGGLWRRGIFPIAVLLALVDLAPLNLVTTYVRHRGERNRVYATLEERIASGRFLQLFADSEGRLHPNLWSYAVDRAIPSTGGPFTQGTPRAYAYLAAVCDTTAWALDRRALTPELVDLLALHNVRYVLASGYSETVTPPDSWVVEGTTIDPEVPGLRIEGAGPVAVLEPGSRFDASLPEAVVRTSGLEVEESRALSGQQLAWMREAKPRVVREARAVVLPNRMEIEVPDLGAATLRIARNVYPSAAVRLDGNPWVWRPGPLGGIAIDVPEGPHRIEVHEVETPLRKGLRIGHWALAGLLFLLAIGPYRR